MLSFFNISMIQECWIPKCFYNLRVVYFGNYLIDLKILRYKILQKWPLLNISDSVQLNQARSTEIQEQKIRNANTNYFNEIVHDAETFV